MPAFFSPTALDYRPEHERSASWFATICKILARPKLDLTCHLQNDGSQIFKYAEEYGRNFSYVFQVWPDGRMKGAREVPNSE
jgi:hypothetical protein